MPLNPVIDSLSSMFFPFIDKQFFEQVLWQREGRTQQKQAFGKLL